MHIVAFIEKMEDILNSKILKSEFERYLGQIFLKNLTLILGMGLCVLFYYMYSDWTVRQNVTAASTRIFPIVIAVVLLIIHLIYKHQYYRFKVVTYILFYIATQLMMYAKCLIHLHEEALAPSVTGSILVIFLLSLDNKQNTNRTIFIYLFPDCYLFYFVVFFMENLLVKSFLFLLIFFPFCLLDLQ